MEGPDAVGDEIDTAPVRGEWGVGGGVVASASEVGAMGGVGGGGNLVLLEVESLNGYAMVHH